MAAATARSKPSQCLIKDCGRPAETRGVCKSCYVHARVLVISGDSTWEELEQLGLVRPAHRHAPKNPLKVAFLAAIENRTSAKANRKRPRR